MKNYTIDPLNKERPLMLVRGTRLPEIFPDYIAEHMANHINAGSRGLFVSINGDVRNIHGAYSTLISTRNDGDNTTSVVMFRESEILQDVEYEDKNGQQCKIVCDKGPKGPYSYGNCTYYTGPYKDLRNFIRDVIPYTGQPLHMDNYNQWYSLTTTDGVELTFRGVIQAQVSDGNYVGLSIDKIELGDTISIPDDLQITLDCDRPVLLGMVNDIGSKRPYDACISIGWLQIVVTDEFKSHLRELDEKSGNGDSEIGINDNYNGFTYNINLNGIFTDPNDFRMPNNSASCRVKVKEGSELCNSTIGDPVGYAIEYFELFRTYQYSESEYYDISIALNGDPVTKDIGAYDSKYIVIRLSNVQSNEELHIDFSGTVKDSGNITGIFVTMNARKVGQVLINSVNNVISIPEGNDMIALFRIDGNNEGGTMTVSRVSKQLEPGFYSADGTLLKAMTKEEVERNYPYNAYPAKTNESIKNATKFVCPEGVTSIGNWTFSECLGLTSLTIPEGVTSIGEYALYGCSSLTSVTIPNTVTSIGDDAFHDCSSLTSVTIPEGVTSIGNATFGSCSSLTSLTIPEGVTSIGMSAFCYCSSLTSVTIPNTVTSIGNEAFYDCSSLTSVTIPEGVTSIGSETFGGCTGLTSVTIPSTVTSIGGSAFSGCTGLNQLTVPNTVTSIGDNAFDNVPKVIYGGTATGSPWGALSVEAPRTPGFYDADGSLLKAMTKEEVETDYTNSTAPAVIDESIKNATEFVWPEGVTKIGEFVFSYCDKLASVTIPDGITSIGMRAFSGCLALTSVTITDGVTSIGGCAFDECSSLISIVIPDGVTSIGYYAFNNCSALESVNIPSTVTSIEQHTFCNCTSLTEVTIPDGVISIGQQAFYKCSKIAPALVVPNGVTTIGAHAFTDVPKLIYSGSATGSPWGALEVSAS